MEGGQAALTVGAALTFSWLQAPLGSAVLREPPRGKETSPPVSASAGILACLLHDGGKTVSGVANSQLKEAGETRPGKPVRSHPPPKKAFSYRALFRGV